MLFVEIEKLEYQNFQKQKYSPPEYLFRGKTKKLKKSHKTNNCISHKRLFSIFYMEKFQNVVNFRHDVFFLLQIRISLEILNVFIIYVSCVNI